VSFIVSVPCASEQHCAGIREQLTLIYCRN